MRLGIRNLEGKKTACGPSSSTSVCASTYKQHIIRLAFQTKIKQTQYVTISTPGPVPGPGARGPGEAHGASGGRVFSGWGWIKLARGGGTTGTGPGKRRLAWCRPNGVNPEVSPPAPGQTRTGVAPAPDWRRHGANASPEPSSMHCSSAQACVWLWLAFQTIGKRAEGGRKAATRSCSSDLLV